MTALTFDVMYVLGKQLIKVNIQISVADVMQSLIFLERVKHSH